MAQAARRIRHSWLLRAMYTAFLMAVLSLGLLLLQDVLTAVESEGASCITYSSLTWRGHYSWSPGWPA
jgi:hypothetical protein